MRSGFGIVLAAGALALVSMGCKENKAATSSCASQGDASSCEACCKSNGANGYKYSSGSCGCLGGKESAAKPAAPAPAKPTAGAGLTLAKTTFAPHESIVITFPRAMTTPPGQQHWVTITSATEPDDAWGAWQYLPQSATAHTLPAPDTAGTWEVRLHDLYPQFPNRVIARQRFTVR